MSLGVSGSSSLDAGRSTLGVTENFGYVHGWVDANALAKARAFASRGRSRCPARPAPPGSGGPAAFGPCALAPDDALGIIRTKLGLQVVDPRVTISHDYADPALGIVPEVGAGTAPVTWIDHGVLTTLSYDRDYALQMLGEPYGVRSPAAYRMSAGPTSIDEMIRSTTRGLLVTRFSNVDLLGQRSLLLTGLTRDGLWLIENGTISRPVKNVRFTASPLFVLNSLEQLGPPVPVFRPSVEGIGVALIPAIVPPLKARDFSFTSLVDAV